MLSVLIKNPLGVPTTYVFRVEYGKWPLYEPPHDKTNKMSKVPIEDSDQPGHLPSLIRVFTVRMKKAWVLSYPLSAQRKLWSDWAAAQADLSLRWADSNFVGFVMRLLKLSSNTYLNCFFQHVKDFYFCISLSKKLGDYGKTVNVSLFLSNKTINNITTSL